MASSLLFTRFGGVIQSCLSIPCYEKGNDQWIMHRTMVTDCVSIDSELQMR